MQNLRHHILWPAWGVLAAFIASYAIYPEATVSALKTAHRASLEFTAAPIVMVSLLCLIFGIGLIFHPAGQMRLGGQDAKPIISRLSWLSIVLCTTLATGILYWAAAEPFLHLHHLQQSQPQLADPQAQVTAIMWHHWSGIPYALFLIPAVTFAILIHNRKLPAQMGSLLRPWRLQKWGAIVDVLCIFAMMAGIASSLATGLIMLSGSIGDLADVKIGPAGMAWLCVLIVITFVASSISGITRGIKWLSYINLVLLAVLACFLTTAVDMGDYFVDLAATLPAYASFLGDLSTQAFTLDVGSWETDWTVFYWSAWIGWAPLCGLFLAQLSKGRRLVEVVWFNLIIPTFLTMMWLHLMSSAAFNIDAASGGELMRLSQEAGPEMILSRVLEGLPFAVMLKALVILCALVSFVTVADSNITVMAGLCMGEPKGRVAAMIKLVFGVMIGLFSWIMVVWLGIDGLRVLNNLAAIPALFVVLLISTTFVHLLRRARNRSKSPQAPTGKVAIAGS